MSASPPVTAALLNEICEAFNRQDVATIVGYFAEAGEWLMATGPEAPWGRRLVGRDEIAEVLTRRYQQIPDLRWGEMRHFAAGERGVSEWRIQGTPLAGPSLDWLGCDLWTFRHGLVVRKDTYWKQISAS